jgi:hypothetical protein
LVQGTRLVGLELCPDEDGIPTHRNEAEGKTEYNEVTATVSVPAAPLVELTLLHESGHGETLRTTDDHPFYVISSETAAKGWTQAQHLCGGDVVSTIKGLALVEIVKFSSETATVYNLSVANAPNYFVGVEGVLAHNCEIDARKYARRAFEEHLGYPLGKGIQVHHRIPQKYREHFHGPDDIVDSIQNMAGVPESIHWDISAMWGTWARNNPNPTNQDIRRFADQVDSQFFSHYILP